ncbi:hypothetical protein YTPLAS18_04780 [Nitrospira sp.]|nr:hypothetical protein YTPLAS18_04780 [Nitrospira sp.]
MTNGRDAIMTGILSFAVGLVVGGAAGVLLTPQSGPRTRRRLANYAEDMYEDVKERATELAEDTTDAVHRVIERGRKISV